MTSRQRWQRIGVFAAVAAAAFIAGVLVRAGCSGGAPSPQPPAAAEVQQKADEETIWTCSMHPQIRQPEPGHCPICGMDLIPVRSDSGAALGPRQIRLSPAARALAEIRTAPVERRIPTRTIRMVGKVGYDETRMAYIAAWVPGRLDRLFVDYTGISVRQGDHMVSLYSPEILTAQEELLQAIKTVENLRNSDVRIVRETSQATVEAAREKLRLWGLTKEQIRQIEASGEPSDHITIYAPIGGIVVHKNAVEGMYVQTGTRIYTIADLTHLWILLDAYESDLPWLRFGQEVEISAEALPGRVFSGRISFIDPILNAKTRTVTVRVNVDNPQGALKPEMFVRARVSARLAAGGEAVVPELAGKWISPMHPEIIKDEPGTCDVCGMPLVKAETLDIIGPADSAAAPPLVVPETAVLRTGRRAVVYVRDPQDEGLFEGREIVLGPQADNVVVVEEGLREGELVVTHGNFKIDSAVQIQAKPSMMSPAGGVAPPGHEHHTPQPAAKPAAQSPPVPQAFSEQLSQTVRAYLQVQTALSADDAGAARTAAGTLLESLDAVDMSLLGHEAHLAWMQLLPEIRQTAKELSVADTIDDARKRFALLSESLTAAVRRFGNGLGTPLYMARCPMAFNNRGALWLQTGDTISNPYFGNVMLTCGEIQETLAPSAAPTE